MSKETIMKLYAVRDKSTGKFVSDITNPRHKFWEKKGSCESAIKSYSPSSVTPGSRRIKRNRDDLELVELTCVESKDYENFNKLAKLYINETSFDGQLFCGCRYEDCENFRTEECYKCLLKHIEETENN